jgi:hypothetical protein
MLEKYMSFSEYIKEYGLERAEGSLLRYLSDVYKVLVQTVPEWAKDARVNDVITYFGAIVRQVDSSLLDEWEKMDDRGAQGLPSAAREEPRAWDVTRDPRAFTVLVRNASFAIVRALAARDYAKVMDAIGPGDWTETRLEAAMKPFWETRAVRVDPDARSPENLRVETSEGAWVITQVLLDSQDENDWYFKATIDLPRAREAGRPMLALDYLGT